MSSPQVLRAGLGLALLAVGFGLAPAEAATDSAGSGEGPGGRIETVAGSGTAGYAGDGGSARSAQLDQPRAAAIDRTGTLFIADTVNHRIRRVEPTGAIRTVAGTGAAGFGGDGGPGEQGSLNWPQGVALSPDDTRLFIADTSNHRIRAVDLASGIITTVAGSGTPGFGGDGGPATAAALSDPKAVAVTPNQELLIADSGNGRIRRVDAAGVITTLAGSGVMGGGGDGGPATAAEFDSPRALAVDGAGNVYVADDNNDRIRRIDTVGVITTVAGSTVRGDEGDGGAAVAAQLNRPRGIAVDAAGNLFIADSMNHRIRMVGTSGVIHTLAGIGREGFGGDGGPAADAKLFSPRGVAVDPAGIVYVADTYNDRIRRIQVGSYTGAGQDSRDSGQRPSSSPRKANGRSR